MEGERLYQPYGVAVDNQGRIFVVDRGKARVVVFNEKGQVLFTFGSLGDGRGQFNCPSAVAVNSKGPGAGFRLERPVSIQVRKERESRRRT